jgi:hypothetical protein
VYSDVADLQLQKGEEESSGVFSGGADLQLKKRRKSVAVCIQVWLTYS